MINKKRVILIGPYNPAKIRVGQYLSPPPGIHRIASYLESNNLAMADVADPTLDYEGTLNKIREGQYDIIGHSVLHPTFEEDMRLIWKAHKLSPNSLQIAGGQGASFNQAEILFKTPITAIARGFGEPILEQILRNNPLNDVKGLYLLQDNKIVSTGYMERMSSKEFRDISINLNFKKMNYQNYWKFMESQYSSEHLKSMQNQGMLRTIRMTVSNGCPLGCTHCSSTNFMHAATEGSQRLLFLKPEEIVDIMDRAKEAYTQTEAFYFNDDNFLLLGKNGILEFCDRINSRGKNENLLFLGRIGGVDKDTLVEMKKANFKIAFYGVETFSDRLAGDISKMKGKKYDYGGLAKRVLKDTLNAGLTAQFSLMLFIPGSKEEDLETTIESSLDVIEEGAKATIFPYVEAYSGADIVEKHELTYKEFEIEGNHFRIPSLVLPDDKNIRNLARDSLNLRDKLNKEEKWKKYGDKVPQPVDTLNIFNSVYKILGKSTSKIEKLLKTHL